MYKLNMWWWHSRVRGWYYKIKYRFTGDCGHYCEYQRLFDIELGEWQTMFIPEAGCAIHDEDDWKI